MPVHETFSRWIDDTIRLREQRKQTEHSKLLEHAWACTPEGRTRLARFIGSLPDIPDRERFLANIARDRYEVETEHVCRRWNKDAFHDQRIDWLIRGNGWQIVIENKIF